MEWKYNIAILTLYLAFHSLLEAFKDTPVPLLAFILLIVVLVAFTIKERKNNE